MTVTVEASPLTMTSPRLAVDSPYGRVYRHPRTAPSEVRNTIIGVQSGLLRPSVTNVIDVLNKPFLNGWNAKLAAECAVDVARTHPGLIESRPDAAVAYIKGAAVRYTEATQDLGTLVHSLVESLGRGEDPGPIPSDAQPFINSWYDFCDKFQPEFLYHEATCFGTVLDEDGNPLGYAGTADFIARMGGFATIGDFKTGKSIHTEVALQLSALAHAEELVTDDDDIIPMPVCEVGAAVHLTRRGFKVHPVTLTGKPWTEFQRLRRAWDFHVQNLDSRGPLLVGKPVSTPDGLADFADRVANSLG